MASCRCRGAICRRFERLLFNEAFIGCCCCCFHNFVITRLDIQDYFLTKIDVWLFLVLGPRFLQHKSTACRLGGRDAGYSIVQTPQRHVARFRIHRYATRTEPNRSPTDHHRRRESDACHSQPVRGKTCAAIQIIVASESLISFLRCLSSSQSSDIDARQFIFRP